MKDLLKAAWLPDVIVLDGMNLVKRFHHGMSALKDSDGVSMGAPYGFARLILEWRKKKTSIKFFVLWEGKNSFRKEIYPAYKSNRKPTSTDVTDLNTSISQLKELLGYLGVTQMSGDGLEADDIAGYLCNFFARSDEQVLLITNDRDWVQYVSDSVRIELNKDGVQTWEDMAEKLKFKPSALPLYKSIVGDASDAIKGLRGFPHKLAEELCNFVCVKYVNDFYVVDSLCGIKDFDVWDRICSKRKVANVVKWYGEFIGQLDIVNRNLKLIMYSHRFVRSRMLGDVFDVFKFDKVKVDKFLKEKNMQSLYKYI